MLVSGVWSTEMTHDIVIRKQGFTKWWCSDCVSAVCPADCDCWIIFIALFYGTLSSWITLESHISSTKLWSRYIFQIVWTFFFPVFFRPVPYLSWGSQGAWLSGKVIVHLQRIDKIKNLLYCKGCSCLIASAYFVSVWFPLSSCQALRLLVLNLHLTACICW